MSLARRGELALFLFIELHLKRRFALGPSDIRMLGAVAFCYIDTTASALSGNMPMSSAWDKFGFQKHRNGDEGFGFGGCVFDGNEKSKGVSACISLGYLQDGVRVDSD